MTDALRAAMDTARDARLRYHREALLNYAVQFQDQLCEKDRLNRTAVRDRIPEMNRAHRRCWYDMLVGEA